MMVVQILYSGLGGHGSVAFSLEAAASERAAWETSLVFLGIEPVLPEYEHLCRQRALAWRYVASRQGAPWRSWAGLYRALVQLRPQAIVLHSVKTILPCWLYALPRGVPIIAVEHQNNALKTPAERRLSSALMSLANAVVVLTPDYRNDLQALVGRHWRADKVHVIPNGIDTRAFAPAPEAPRQRHPLRVGMASRFSAIKRHDLLLGAMALLQAQDGPGAWRLSLAGEGETRAAVWQQANALGVQDAVELPGYLGEADLCRWFASLDVYAHASEGESLSTSLLQAMAKGLPIFGSPVAGITNLLAEGGGCGLLAEAQTPEAFAQGLRRLAEDAELSSALGRRARQLAEQHYSQDTMFGRYQQLLLSCKKSST
jgi:glycosyltransferase involved in cell wall biosynthesis